MIEILDGVEVATIGTLPALSDEDFVWSVEVLRSFSSEDSSGRPRFYDPTRLLPLANGNLWLLDREGDRPLSILDGVTGGVLAAFGRMGRGPNELSQPDLGQGADGTLVAFDPMNRRVQRFLPDGTRKSGELLAGPGVAGKTLWDRAGGRFLAESLFPGPEEWVRGIAVMEAERDNLTELLSFSQPIGSTPQNIQPGRSVWTSTGSYLITMWSGEPSITIRDSAGTPVRVLRLPFTRRDLSQHDVDVQVGRHGAIASFLRPGPIALTNELFQLSDSVFAMMVTKLWHPKEDHDVRSDARGLRMFTVGGDYLGVVWLPEESRIVGLGDGTLFLSLLDSSLRPVIQEVRLRPPT